MNTFRALVVAGALLGGFVSHAAAEGYPNPVWDIDPGYQTALAANRPVRPEVGQVDRFVAQVAPGYRAQAPRVTGSVSPRAEAPVVNLREWQLLHSRGR